MDYSDQPIILSNETTTIQVQRVTSMVEIRITNHAWSCNCGESGQPEHSASVSLFDHDLVRFLEAIDLASGEVVKFKKELAKIQPQRAQRKKRTKK